MTAQEHIDAQAPDDRVKELEAELAATEIAIAEYRQQCLDNAAEIARLRSESEERLQNCAALVAEVERLLAASEFPANWAQMLHYPECWDTSAYPELRDAIHEVLAWPGCSVCKPATAPERKPMHEGEIQAAWLGQDLDEPIPYTFVLGIRSAERFNGIKEQP
jgi:hypothetical protein